MSSQPIKLFVDVEDVRLYHRKSSNWCYDRLKHIRQSYQLQAHERVTLFQFCEFEKLPYKKLIKLQGLQSAVS